MIFHVSNNDRHVDVGVILSRILEPQRVEDRLPTEIEVKQSAEIDIAAVVDIRAESLDLVDYSLSLRTKSKLIGKGLKAEISSIKFPLSHVKWKQADLSRSMRSSQCYFKLHLIRLS